MKKILKILLYYPFIDPELSNRLEFDEELGAYVKSVVKAYDQQEALYKIEEEKLNTVFLNPIEGDGSINSTTIELIETIRNRFPRKVAIVLYTEIDSKPKLQTSYPEIQFHRFISVDANKTGDEYYRDLSFALRNCYNYVASEVQQEETHEQETNNQSQSNSTSSVEIGVALLFAGVVLATLIFLVLNPRAMDEGTLAIVRFLAACFAGLAGYLFSGNLNLEGTIPSLTKAQIKASGGFAAFIIVFILFFLPVPESSNSNGSDDNGRDVPPPPQVVYESCGKEVELGERQTEVLNIQGCRVKIQTRFIGLDGVRLFADVAVSGSSPGINYRSYEGDQLSVGEISPSCRNFQAIVEDISLESSLPQEQLESLPPELQEASVTRKVKLEVIGECKAEEIPRKVITFQA